MSLSPGFAWVRRVRSSGCLALICGGLASASFASDLTGASDWSTVAEQASSQTGAALATGDINNDGYTDVVVGVPNFDTTTSTDVGAVRVFYGSAAGLPALASLTLVGPEDGALFGSAIAVGDVNNDGFADIVAGAPFADSAVDDLNAVYGIGSVSIYLGSASGIAATSSWVVRGDRTMSRFGASVAIADDISGDGFGDVLVGATYRSDERNPAAPVEFSGAVYAFNGTATVPASTPAWIQYGTQGAAFFGGSIATGDFNNDGYSDVVIGAASYDSKPIAGVTLWDVGAVYVFTGSATGLAEMPAVTITGTQTHSYLGEHVALAGDVDNDGYADLLVSAAYHDNDENPRDVQTNSGAVFLYKGSASGLVTTAPAWLYHGAQAYAYFGSSIAGLGDVNGDGYADVVIGAPGHNNDENPAAQIYDAGRVMMFYGSASGLSVSPTWFVTASLIYGNFGSSVAMSDVNNDGFGDLIAGAEYYAGSGAVFAFMGTTMGTNTAPQISTISNTTIAQDMATNALPFTVADIQTPAASLTLIGSSSNTALVPNENIVFGGAGASRTVVVTPSAGKIGVAVITIAVSDGSYTTTTTFTLSVNNGVVTPGNVAPTISAIADQVISLNATTSALGFTIADGNDGVASLTLSLASSNTNLVPTANVVISGTGAARNVTVTPVANTSGVSAISITVSDGILTSTTTFNVTVNTPPTISNMSDVMVGTGVSTGALSFTVGDSMTLAPDLLVTASSSNTAVIPHSNIYLAGSGASRSVSIQAGSVGGNAVITLTVSDGFDSASTQFNVSVNAPPAISAIASQTVTTGAATNTIGFSVSDAESAAGALVLSASSTNSALVAATDIVFGGSGGSRTVTVTPQAGQTGSATITVTVSDGIHAVSTNFVVTVTAVNTAPSVTSIANQSVANGAATTALAFTVADAESAASALNVSATSSDIALVPNTNILLGGGGTDRSVTVTPVAGQSGAAVITLTVTDGAMSVTTSFTVTVSAPVSGGSSGSSGGGSSGGGSSGGSSGGGSSSPAPAAKSSGGGGSFGLPLIVALALVGIARRRG